MTEKGILQGHHEGATLSLNAIGQQDKDLLRDEPDYSFFNYKTEQHSNFTKYHRGITVYKSPAAKPTWPFGESVKVTLNPQNMGDLLCNMYVKIKFPAVESNSNIADQIGRHVLESVTMNVDELEVDKYHDDWGIIYDELYLDSSEKRTKRYMLNRNQADNTSHLNDHLLSRYPSELLIPIPLFFSRKYEGDEYESNSPNRPYFPTCAAYKQKIIFDFKFRPPTFFTNNRNAHNVLTLPEFSIFMEEITVTDEERLYLKLNKQVFITDIVKKHPSTETEVGKENVKLQLVPDIPVKSLFWFLRKKAYEDETVSGSTNLPDANSQERNFSNRFNFSSASTYSISNSFFNAVMESAKIFINGQDLPNVPKPDHSYYKYLIPYNHRLSRPDRNIYTYAFAMNPINVEPSGSLDFSKLNSDRTILDVTLKQGLTDVYTLNMYYVGYQTLIFEKGFMKLAAPNVTRYIPEVEPSVTPSGPLGARPRPSGAGVGNLLQLKDESTPSGPLGSRPRPTGAGNSRFSVEGYSLPY